MPLLSYLRNCGLVVVIATCATAAVGANADEPLSQETQNRIEELVQQLGNDSYRGRERAADELLKIGMPTKPALFAGMKSKDLEVAIRCRRLWSEVRIDAGWQQVREVIGDSPASRDLYDQMFLAAPAVWYELAETPRAADILFEERRGQLQEQLKDKQADNWEGALANLLYFGVRVKKELPQKELPRVDDLLSTGRSQQAIADIEPLRGLLDEWTSVTRTDGPAFDRLLVALRDRHPQAVEIAREILSDRETPAKQRQYALLALASSNSPEDDKLINDALNDSSPLDILFTKGLVIKSQLRDVALAVRIARNGQDPAEFGFNYLRPNECTTYSPSSLGFRDSAERNAAFEKWLAFTRRQMFEEKP
jgi:hypothetical protein